MGEIMGGLLKESISFEGALWGGLLLEDPEGSGKKGLEGLCPFHWEF
jgi:hypothetical protein